MEPWLAGTEPTLTCAACGEAHLVGDWLSRRGFYVAEVAIQFNNWSDIDAAFLSELGAVLGPRSRVLYTRW